MHSRTFRIAHSPRVRSDVFSRWYGWFIERPGCGKDGKEEHHISFHRSHQYLRPRSCKLFALPAVTPASPLPSLSRKMAHNPALVNDSTDEPAQERVPAIVGSLASLEASLLPPSALFSQFSHAFQPVSRVVSRQRGLMRSAYSL